MSGRKYINLNLYRPNVDYHAEKILERLDEIQSKDCKMKRLSDSIRTHLKSMLKSGDELNWQCIMRNKSSAKNIWKRKAKGDWRSGR